jgi:TetR/AcrR family transcriptional repressor of nem operon
MADRMRNQTKSEQTREKVILAGMDLINRQGYCATSMDEITQATGVKKGNLYFHFSSKEELVIELLSYAREEFLSYLKSNVRGQSSKEKIKNVLEAGFRFHRKKDFIGGCIFANIALEMADSNARLSEFVRDVLEDWIILMAGLLRQAQESGEIKLNCEPEVMARHIVASVEGGVMFSRLSKNGQELRDCINAVYSILGINA